MKNVIYLIRQIPGIKKYVIFLTALNLLGAAIGAIQPYAFKIIIDSIVSVTQNPSAATSVIYFALGLLLAVRLINTLFNYINQLQSTNVFFDIVNGLRTIVFRQVTRLSIDYFEKEKIGAISQRYNSTTNDVARWSYDTLSNFLPQITTVIVALVILFITNALVGIVTLISIILFFVTQVPTLKKLRPLMKEAQKSTERASAYFSETIGHIATVRSLGGEQSILQKQIKELQTYKDLRMQRTRRLEFNIGVRQIIYTFMIVTSISIIAFGVIHGQQTAGDILLVALYLQQIQSSLWPIGRMIIDTTEIDASAERIVTMLETKPTVIDPIDALKLEDLKTLEFKNVSFCYPGKKTNVLDGISFKIEPGQTFALVGRSGVGKTTITKLLLRFYEPTNGKILINDRPIQDFTQESVRRHIGVVMQDVALFNDSIEANLQLASPKASKKEVKSAAAQAHADVFIEKLPEKYNTLVGERGIKLSGGEKQRVAIARAILKDPQLIILDEATSALDSESEQHVQAGLRELMSGRTAIVIAHRLSTVMRADRILVIENGRVTEQGTHSELLAKNSGIYAKLFKLQSGALAAS